MLLPQEPCNSDYSTYAVSLKVQHDGFDSWKIHFFNFVDEFRKSWDVRLILLPQPLSLDLKKYLTKPDYEGHVAFIESFHLDLTRLVQSYAGRRRIFIFIDDHGDRNQAGFLDLGEKFFFSHDLR